MKLFKPGLLIIVVAIFLAAVFIGILYLQKPSPTPTGVHEPGHTPAVTGASNDSTPETRIAQRSVNISFTGSNQHFEFKDVPLYKVTLQGDKPIEVVADGDLARQLIEQLPSLPGVATPTPSRLEKRANDFARIIRGEPGLSIDKAKTLEALEKSIKQGPDAATLSVDIVIGENEGKESFAAKMKETGFTTLIATYSTLHKDHIDDDNRNVNLAIASQKIDGLIIQPGGKFSFNKVVGPRTEKCGFKKAGVISQGRVIPGLGGGICQVSTTLYRAMLLSGMKIDERHNHSIYDGIDYADRGLDAAVAWGFKDFRFTNTLDIPVIIVSRAGKGVVEVEIYAEKKPFDEVVLEIRNEVKHPYAVQKKNNSALKKGEVKVVHPGVHGYTVESFRRITSSGKTKEERLSKDRYLTFNRIEEINN